MAVMSTLMLNAIMALLFFGIVLIVPSIAFMSIGKVRTRKSAYAKPPSMVWLVLLTIGTCMLALPVVYFVFITVISS